MKSYFQFFFCIIKYVDNFSKKKYVDNLWYLYEFLRYYDYLFNCYNHNYSRIFIRLILGIIQLLLYKFYKLIC
jgi:hypothetical protein